MNRVERASRDVSKATAAILSISEHLSEMQKEIESLREMLKARQEILTALSVEKRQLEREVEAFKKAASKEPKQKPIPVKYGFPETSTDSKLKKPKLDLSDRILWALYHRQPEALTRIQVYYYAHVSPTSGPSRAAYADLNDDGFIKYARYPDQVRVSITAEGLVDLDRRGINRIAFPSSFEAFDAFCKLQTPMVQKFLRAHYQLKTSELSRDDWCDKAGVSRTSGPSRKALGRLASLEVCTYEKGVVHFTPWYLSAIQPTVRVFDKATNETREHDTIAGKVVR